MVRRPVGVRHRAVPLIRTATFDDLDARTLYAILKLRAEVFVVEQQSRYADLDGRDLDPRTLHCWIPAGGEVAAYLRIVGEADGWRIGRVVTATRQRGRGHANALLRHALSLLDGPIVLDAQTYLVGWYARLGFQPDGPEFVEDGIDHTPMRRCPAALD